jgi:signal transduction histidine kinase
MSDLPIEVLLIDDDEDYFVLIEALLAEIAGQQYVITWVSTYDTGLSALLESRADGKVYDVCLLDYNLGAHTGLELLKVVLDQGHQSPIIMLTAQGDRKIDVEAMRIGAADYLYKRKTDSDLLERSIRYAIDRAQTLFALRESEQRNAELYQQEQERSQELARAYIALRRMEGMRDDLTRMIVHDLRSPLTVISNSLDMLKLADTNPIVAQNVPALLEGARTAVQRIIGMIEDMLHVSKFEAGELRPSFRTMDPATFLRRKEKSFRSLAAKEEKVFTIEVAENLTGVMVDEELIDRVMDNLINNAFKYTEPGGRITVTIRGSDKSILFQVQDDGQGISPDYHDRIFDKFVQVTSPSGEPLRKGTGLGLAFCRLAVEAHGGKIWVDSVPGKGSTFSFILPLKQPPARSGKMG